jgi:HTH-type transcriptional regulator/antitoxin HigA
MRMDIRPLRTEADYDWALLEIEQYFNRQPIPGSPRADRFDVLAALIAEYERRHCSIDPPDPGAAIRARMEQAGYTQGDLARLLGSRSRASEILAGRRGLTMEQARRLHEAWHIPAEALIQPSGTPSPRVADHLHFQALKLTGYNGALGLPGFLGNGLAARALDGTPIVDVGRPLNLKDEAPDIRAALWMGGPCPGTHARLWLMDTDETRSPAREMRVPLAVASLFASGALGCAHNASNAFGPWRLLDSKIRCASLQNTAALTTVMGYRNLN